MKKCDVSLLLKINVTRAIEIAGKKRAAGRVAHTVIDQERRYSRSAMPESPAVTTVPVQKPGAAFGVTGGCVLSAVVPGDAAGVVSAASFGDTGSTVVLPGTVAVTAGVAVRSEVVVAAGVLDDEEPCEPEDDAAVSAGVTVSRETMFPLSTTSKVFVTNCVSLHRGSRRVTVPPPGPTQVSRMTAREAGSAAEIPSVLVTPTFAYPVSLSILGTTFEPGISLLAVMSSIRTMSLS